jgi:hypothetical protein
VVLHRLQTESPIYATESLALNEIPRRADKPPEPASGDLNLSNIVLLHGRFQFVDPGLAMALGVGLPMPECLCCDCGWDLATLAHSVAWHGSKSCADTFLNSYAKAPSLSCTSLRRKIRFWEALHSLFVTAVCFEQWKLLCDPVGSLLGGLTNKNQSLFDYTKLHFEHALAAFDLAREEA